MLRPASERADREPPCKKRCGELLSLKRLPFGTYGSLDVCTSRRTMGNFSSCRGKFRGVPHPQLLFAGTTARYACCRPRSRRFPHMMRTTLIVLMLGLWVVPVVAQ